MHRLAAIAVLLTATTGCYSYTRVQASEVGPGSNVRARVTGAAGDRVAPLLGTAPRVLTGKLISDARDTVIVEVPHVTQAEIGSTVQTLHQRVALARTDVIEWEIRTLNRPRTYALVGGAVAAAVALLINSLQGEPGSNRLPGDGGVDALVPLFRISR
ncbi:MAG: hypothetical protein AB1762_04065 [Gemmatimonadota bacterium]